MGRISVSGDRGNRRHRAAGVPARNQSERGLSRPGNAVGRQLPAGTIADGEIVRWSTHGRLDFEALQRRNRSAGRGARDLARTEPCHLILFDLLRLRDQDLTGAPLTDRRAQLDDLLGGTGAAAVVVGMQTDDLEIARASFDQLAAVGIEGIVAKRAREPYRPGAQPLAPPPPPTTAAERPHRRGRTTRPRYRTQPNRSLFGNDARCKRLRELVGEWRVTSRG